MKTKSWLLSSISLLLCACQTEQISPVNTARDGGLPMPQIAASSIPAPLATDAVAKDTALPVVSEQPQATPAPSSSPLSTPAVTVPSASPAPVNTPAQAAAVQVAMQTLRVPRGFDYAMSRQVALQVQARNPNGAAYARVPVGIFADPEHTQLLAMGITDLRGEFQTALQLPLTQEHLSIRLSALGIANTQTVRLQGTELKLNFGPQK